MFYSTWLWINHIIQEASHANTEASESNELSVRVVDKNQSAEGQHIAYELKPRLNLDVLINRVEDAHRTPDYFWGSDGGCGTSAFFAS